MRFVYALFDFSFTDFVIGQLVKVLYFLSMIGIAVFYLIAVIGALTQSLVGGALVLLFIGPIGVLLGLVYVRVTLELIMVLFKIYENTRLIARNGSTGPSAPVAPLTGPESH